jgi:hypothetical protein
MTGEKLFKDYYEPKLIEQGIDNVVLRTYTHIKGLSTDDPDNSTELLFTPRNEVDKRLDDIFSVHAENKGMAVTSIVSYKTEQRNLFLLDCSVSVSDENEKELIVILKNSKSLLPALESSMLLRTKNSYHLVCFVPLSKDDWQSHMAQVILLCNSKKEHIGDIRYIGHSIERGYGSLRISDYQGKPTPDFVCYL